jgi:DnaJ-domain-containing protein 1
MRKGTDLMRVSVSFIEWLDKLKVHENQSRHEICDKIRKLLEESGYKEHRKLKDKLAEIEL